MNTIYKAIFELYEAVLIRMLLYCAVIYVILGIMVLSQFISHSINL